MFYCIIREKEHLLRVKILTVQIISVITQRHPFLGARSRHRGGGWWSWRHSLALGGEKFSASAGWQLLFRQILCVAPEQLLDLIQVEKVGTEPILFHSNKVKVNHGLIVIADSDDPERLNVSWFNYWENRWLANFFLWLSGKVAFALFRCFLP